MEVEVKMLNVKKEVGPRHLLKVGVVEKIPMQEVAANTVADRVAVGVEVEVVHKHQVQKTVVEVVACSEVLFVKIDLIEKSPLQEVVAAACAEVMYMAELVEKTQMLKNVVAIMEKMKEVGVEEDHEEVYQ